MRTQANTKQSSNKNGADALRMISLKLIDPPLTNTRTQFREESLEDLTRSIEQKGVLQPILVRQHGSRFQIIAGERRFRAANRA